MSTGLILAVLCGVGMAVGLTLVAAGVHAMVAGEDQPADRNDGWERLRARWASQHGARRLAVAVAVAVLTVFMTRWPVAGVLAGLGSWFLPSILGPDREHAAAVARIEAIASWTEMLRDTLSAAAGIEQAILATAVTAPAPIAQPVAALAVRVRRGDRLPDALRTFGDELGDPTGDLVVAALLMATEQQARHLADLLGDLAAAAREQAGLRMRQAAGRARTRTSVRVIVGTTLSMAVGLILLNRAYLDPYGTPTGQLVLAFVGGLFGLGFAWLTRLARPEPAERHLATTSQAGAAR